MSNKSTKVPALATRRGNLNPPMRIDITPPGAHCIERPTCLSEPRVFRIGSPAPQLPTWRAGTSSPLLGPRGVASQAQAGGRRWWAHLLFTRVNIGPIIPRNQLEEEMEIM